MSLQLPWHDPSYDVNRSGPPAWARKDPTGPLNTYVPGPISNEWLVNSHHTDVRLIVSGVLFLAVIVFVVVKAEYDVTGTVLGLIGLWMLYGVPTWLRGRVGLRVDGDRCEVRGWVRTTTFAGEDVAKVLYVFAGRSPDIRLVLRDGRKVMVVASRLEKGHSTLFEWLRRYAPTAEYDQKAIDVRDMLVTRGLMGAPGDAWDMYGPGKASTNRIPETSGEADTTRTPEEQPGEGGTARLPEKQPGETGTTRIPEEQPGEAPLRLEGSPTTPLAQQHADETSTTPVPEEQRDGVSLRLEGPAPDSSPDPESEDTLRIPEEQLREARQRLGTSLRTSESGQPEAIAPVPTAD